MTQSLSQVLRGEITRLARSEIRKETASPRKAVSQFPLSHDTANYAKLAGVVPLTSYNWENENAKPRKEQLAALVAVRKLGKREAERRLEMMDWLADWRTGGLADWRTGEPRGHRTPRWPSSYWRTHEDLRRQPRDGNHLRRTTGAL